MYNEFDLCSIHKAHVLQRPAHYRPGKWTVARLITAPFGISVGAWIAFATGMARWLGMVSIILNAVLIAVMCLSYLIIDYVFWCKKTRRIYGHNYH